MPSMPMLTTPARSTTNSPTAGTSTGVANRTAAWANSASTTTMAAIVERRASAIISGVARRLRITRKDERLAAEMIRRILADRQARTIVLAILLIALAAYTGWFVWKRTHATAAPPPTTTPAANPAGRVRIATWNLRKFSERDKAGE